MKKSIVFITILILIGLNIQGQNIVRKGTFGAQMQMSENGNGVEILYVFEKTTASNLGIVEGDIIEEINGETFETIDDVVAYIGTWYANDEIQISLRRKTEPLKLNGLVVAKPYETSTHGEVIYGEVAFDGGYLRSILEIPSQVENPPVVLFLPGVGCGSLDYYYNPKATTKLLIEALVEKGIAVYRVEKPGMGDSFGTINCEEMDYLYEVSAFEAALDQLKTTESVDGSKIFLYGHSLGTLTAPLVAENNDIAGIIAWGGLSKTFFEYTLMLERDQEVLKGNEYEQIETKLREDIPFYYDFYFNRLSPNQLLEKGYTAQCESHFYGDMYYGLQHYTFFQTANDVDILSAYKKVQCPVLCLAGEYDLHAINTNWAKEIADAVNYYNEGQGEYYIVPKTTHHYFTIPSKEVYIEMRTSGMFTTDYMAQHFSENVPFLISRWIKEKTSL